MALNCEQKVKPGSIVTGKCCDCKRELKIRAPKYNRAVIFSCQYCGSTNTFTNKEHVGRDDW